VGIDNMKIILCSMVTHYSHTAVALQNARYLKKYITGFILTNHKWENIINNLPMSFMMKLIGSGRYNNHLNTNSVISLWYIEIIRKVLKLLPFIGNYNVTLITNAIFSSLCTLYLNDFDILHVVSSQGPSLLQKAKRKGKFIVLDERGAHPTYVRRILSNEYAKFNCLLDKRIFFEDVRKKEYELADYIFVPSQFVFNTFVEMGIKKDKLFIVPYGVNIETFRQIPKMDKTFRVLYVGRISLAKGVHYLLEAWRQLRLKNAELLLIGRVEKSFKPILEKYKDIFKHISNVPNNELYKFYSNSSVFVLPSLTEGSALVAYEAMACGLPVIITENCGTVVRDEKDGFIIPIKDIEALKEKIFTLYKNEDLRRQMGNSSKEYVKNFTWKKYEKGIVETYNKIATLCNL